MKSLSADMPIADFADAFRTWIRSNSKELEALLAPRNNYSARVEAARSLRHVLWDADWARWGWPERVGGCGGSILHRAVVTEELYRVGWTGPTIFEHLEIIAPTLVAHATPGFAAKVVPEFINGRQAWAQGFSEPEAGSDLASLRTRAESDGPNLIVNGAKIWTTWAPYADWCLALVRTGTREERHRGLTMLAIDLHSAGVVVSPIRQANGVDELAEVAFTDVTVPHNQVVGEIGGGWRVAMYLLARERGTLSWLKHCGYRAQLTKRSSSIPDDMTRQFGDLVLQTAGVRAAAATLLAREARGEELGATAAFNKLLMTRTEQNLFNLLRDVCGSELAVPDADLIPTLFTQEYLFSRIVTIYGGSQQMQLMTVAKHVLGLGNG